MSLEMAARVADVDRVAARRDRARAARADVLRRRAAAEHAGRSTTWPSGCTRRAQARGVQMLINIITNGLLLTREMVDRLNPLGLNGIKITLDGDREAHNQIASAARRPGHVRQDHREHPRGRRPARGSPIGGNFDEDTVDSLSGAARLPRASRISRPSSSKVTFKPVIREKKPRRPKGHDPAHRRRRRRQAAERRVHDVGRHRRQPRLRHLQLRRRQDVVPARGDEEARLRRPPTACTWARARSTRATPTRSAPTARCSRARASPARRCSRPATSTAATRRTAAQALRNFEKLAAWEQCNDCAFIPVCAGGCTVAAHNELGDMHAPNCHKPSFEAGLVALAHDAARDHAAPRLVWNRESQEPS